MKTIVLGNTGLKSPQNAFGALPVQRVEKNAAVRLLQKAREGGFTFFDTARAYTDSEEKLGLAFGGNWDGMTIATKSAAREPKLLREDIETSLRLLKADHIDLFQLHNVGQCYSPDDGTGLYEALLDAKQQGLISHIGATTHKIGVAEQLVESGLYETLQFPFSYLASDRDIALVKKCAAAGVGFIAMKGLSGGLLGNSRACMAFMSQFDNVLPIWGIQRESELDEWISYFEDTPALDDEMKAYLDKERAELLGDFCRGCNYCAPCAAGIVIYQCARMSQMVRRSPSDSWLSEHWQQEMAKIDECIGCGACMSRCPYELNIPELLRKNLADYRDILAGRVDVRDKK